MMLQQERELTKVEDIIVPNYEALALLYDQWDTGIETSQKLNFLKQIWADTQHEPRRVLDLACGTGEIALALARDGLMVVGVDISPRMLEVAKSKMKSPNTLDITWILGDMRLLESNAEFDTVICLHDSLNYILTEEDLKAVFLRVRGALTIGGVFLFDLNTPYKLDKVFGSTVYAEDRGEFAYIWLNSRNGQISQFDIRFFLHEGKGLFRRLREIHYQRSYERDSIEMLLEQCGFNLIRVGDGFSLDAPSSTCLRESYLAVAE